MASKYRPYLDDFEQWPFIYAARYFYPSGGTLFAPFFDQTLAIQGDADFVVRAWSLDMSQTAGELVGLSPTAASDLIGIRGRFPDESRIITLSNKVNQAITTYPQVTTFFGKAFVPSPGALVASALDRIGVLGEGTAQDPLPIIPEKYIPKAGTVFFDVQTDQTANPLWIEVALHGVKLKPKGTYYALDPSIPYKTEEFTYTIQLPQPAAGTTLLKQIVALDGDSAFKLCAIYSTQVTAKGYSFLFYGPNGEQLEACTARTIAGGGNAPQPSLVSGGNCLGSSRRPRTLNPPVMYPPNGAITFDYRIPNPAPPNDSDRPMFLNFTGLKIYGPQQGKV